MGVALNEGVASGASRSSGSKRAVSAKKAASPKQAKRAGVKKAKAKAPATGTRKARGKAPVKAPAKTTRKTAPKASRPVSDADIIQMKPVEPGKLPILYMLSPQKFMSPFDCNMAIDSGYRVVIPFGNVEVADVAPLVQDAMFSRPPGANSGVFLGGKDIPSTLRMIDSAKAAMVPSFEISIFADPGGSFTTAGAMVACTERIVRQKFNRDLEGLTVSVFGATGVVGFSSAVLLADVGAKVRVVAHAGLDQLDEPVALAKHKFGVDLEPVAGHNKKLKADLVGSSDIVFTAGPAGVNILTRQQIARSSRLMVAADVNAVAPAGVEGLELFMNGVPMPGSSALGLGALAIGDIKYKTQAGLFQQMIKSDKALMLDFRDAFAYARTLTAERLPVAA